MLISYTETIDYLFTKLPMFSRIGVAAYKKDLTNTLALCAALGNPQHQFKSIHIAGTNGKGSTSHMLAAVLQQAGYKVGLYTSPHLKDFRERIRINGAMISEQAVINFTNTIMAEIQIIEPSFFEITVAMAFDYFAKEKVDIAIIETGLGGRLDSTNIITPLLSIITNIGYDHQALLGDTLPLIAGEKAGIIKPKVPVIIGEALPDTKPIFIEKAKECNVPIYFAEQCIKITEANSLVVDNKLSQQHEIYFLDLGGSYQIKNSKAVLVAIHLLNELGYHLPYSVVQTALQNVKKLTGLKGRFETINSQPLTIVDVAHNIDGIKALLQSLEKITVTNFEGSLHFIIGMVKDKDIDAVLELLPKDATYYFTQANIPRALPKEELQAKAANLHLQGSVYDNVNNAIAAATQQADALDIIIVCGSVFLIGEVAY